MKRKKIYVAICILIFVIALLVTIYPIVSNYLAERSQTKVYADYSETIEKYGDKRLNEEKQKAISYNDKQISEDIYENGCILAYLYPST